MNQNLSKILIWCCVCANFLLVESYETKYDNINLDDIFKSTRLMNNYMNCLKGKGPCTPDGKELKDKLPDALKNDCKLCSERQKVGAGQVIRFIVDNRPDDFRELEALYDPTGEYRSHFLDENLPFRLTTSLPGTADEEQPSDDGESSTATIASYLTGIGAVLVDVGVVGIVLGLQVLPLFGTVIDQVVQHLFGSGLLLLAALGTVGLQGIGQHLLKLVAVRGATALIHQTLVVVVEEAVRLQDLVQVDAVVLGGVFVLGGHHGEQSECSYDEQFHLDICGAKTIMKLLAVAVFVLLACLAQVQAQEEQYTTKYDNIDLDEILKSTRLFNNYFKCLMDEGPCTPDGKELKRLLPEALLTNCAKCSEVQKAGALKVVNHTIENRPEQWKALQAKYDPENVYIEKYRTEEGITL
ncbi:uncharacterized protein LOC129741277 [Uranotaenia lowii]|uniref:uncharacterized protein LOC129741277 n=1 Tax=Uranotaenia lowii TaxID=190385 RepID=UPI002479B68B|nr:uncharacterized protein LOC129741277 [Uranotaenia lowii]